MCGRFTLRISHEKLVDLYGLIDVPELARRYNIAPSQRIAAVVEAQGARVLKMFRWGLIPAWAKDPAIGVRLINARSETAAKKPAFRGAFKQRRCLICADGFYEWQKAARGKVPWFFQLRGGVPFAFAGLWKSWSPLESGEAIETCALLTTEPNEIVGPIHNRMPVILSAKTYGAWLDTGAANLKNLPRLFEPYPAEAMMAYPVKDQVNRPQFDDPQCVEPLPDEQSLFDD